jgi:hypothetical protein
MNENTIKTYAVNINYTDNCAVVMVIKQGNDYQVEHCIADGTGKCIKHIKTTYAPISECEIYAALTTYANRHIRPYDVFKNFKVDLPNVKFRKTYETEFFKCSNLGYVNMDTVYDDKGEIKYIIHGRVIATNFDDMLEVVGTIEKDYDYYTFDSYIVNGQSIIVNRYSETY